MSFSYIFLETAQREYEETLEWYQQRSQEQQKTLSCL